MENGGRTRKEYFNHGHDLWQQHRHWQDDTKVPLVVPFQIPFPTHYTNERGTFSLPSTYGVTIPVANVGASNVYYLRVTVTKRRFIFGDKQKTWVLVLVLALVCYLGAHDRRCRIEVRLRYYPFSYPPAPLPAGPPSLSVIESTPADWHKVHSTINSRDPAWDTIHCFVSCHTFSSKYLSDLGSMT